MYFSRLLLICLFISPFYLYSADSTARKKPPAHRNNLMLCFHYGRQTPMGDLANRFGSSNTLGATLLYKFSKNFQIQFSFNTLFSGKVKENNVLDSLIKQGNYLVDINGQYAEVKMYERGILWHVDVGKIIPISTFNRNSGILVTAGAGYMQHKIKFTFQKTVLPQLENGNFRGYDRLTGGLMWRGFVGYQRIDPKKMLSFMIGIEYMQGFTKSIRGYNYDTRMADTQNRNDILFGLKAGLMVTLAGKTAGIKSKQEEKYFE